MQRRTFLSTSLLAAPALSDAAAAAPSNQAAARDVYEWREYELRGGAGRLDAYLSKALIPALNRQGVKQVGVFRELSRNEPAKVFVLIAYPSSEAYFGSRARLSQDTEYQKASEEYNQIAVDRPLYDRIRTSLLLAFEGMPQLVAPVKEPRIFEWRTYEGYSEDAVRRKIKMFNEAEIGVFKNVKLNAVFFGEMIAGEQMPCLTYLLTFKDMAERDKNWAAFSADPEWKRISPLPEYANTVSRITRIFLEPTAYSQV